MLHNYEVRAHQNAPKFSANGVHILLKTVPLSTYLFKPRYLIVFIVLFFVWEINIGF